MSASATVPGSNTANLASLFQTAADEGDLGTAALANIQQLDLGQQIGNAMGMPAGNFKQSEIVLVSLLIDDSGSIRFAQNAPHIREGYNECRAALIESKQQNNVLWHCRYLGGHILCPYVPIDQSPTMDEQNYNPNSGTPLYDQTGILLAAVLAKHFEFASIGVPCRSVSLILTDGADLHSTIFTPAKVNTLVTDMLSRECHIVAGMGVTDPHASGVDFRMIFTAMGIPNGLPKGTPDWILTGDPDPNKTPEQRRSEIRKLFQTFSQSAILSQKSATSFSQQAAGGFAKALQPATASP